MDNKELIIDFYVNKKKSANYIAKYMGISIYNVAKLLKENGIIMRNRHECHKKHSVNSNYFSNINTHNKAQILGFFCADGCVFKNLFIIRISNIDKDYLDFIKKDMEFTGDIKTRSGSRAYKNCTPISSLCFSDVKMINDLKQMGIGERKSLTLEFPSEQHLPKEFIPSFIRGYFEGDGSIGIDKTGHCLISICGSKDFLIPIKNYLKNSININSWIGQHTQYKNSTQNHINILYISGNQQILSFLTHIYENSNYKMQRKYSKIQEIINIYKSGIKKFRKLKRNNYKGIEYYEKNTSVCCK